MRTADFDYSLPPELIAQVPLEPRDASRLLVVHRDDGHLEHRHFRDMAEYLRPGDLLVGNNSRVIPARLFGCKSPTGGRVEMLLTNKRDDGSWEVLLKPGRRVKPGARIAIQAPSAVGTSAPPIEDVSAEVVDITPAGGRVVRFSRPIEPLLERIGVVPLPPYIHTPLADSERYQTVYARVNGSVAAPTAGLHFTPEMVEQMRRADVELAFVTLHISMDTFRPVQEEELTAHRMYSEFAELAPETAAAINRTRARGGRVVAVGTTSVRVLETAGTRLAPGGMELQPFAGRTALFIYPGFPFRVVDALLTNFHLPRSTLLMLVAAFAGGDLIRYAYAEAVAARYRFYSLGDAMLVI